MLMVSFRKIKKDKSSGFTLVETITVVILISILSVVMLANYHGSQKYQSIQRTAHQLAGDIRKAQNMAITSAGYGSGVPYGYGIYINKSENRYILFTENDNNNKEYDTGDVNIETVNLSSQIQISEISNDPNKADIFFEPPDPTTYIDADSSPGKETQITLKFIGTSYEKNITVRTSGQIEIQ